MSGIDLHTPVIPPTVVEAMRRDPQRFGTKVVERNGELYFERRGRVCRADACESRCIVKRIVKAAVARAE